jgi:hypothetical protein
VFEDIIEKAHQELQAHRRAKGLKPWVFPETRPTPRHGVLESLMTVELALCSCGCGEALSEASVAIGRRYRHGHKPAKVGKIRLTTPTINTTTYGIQADKPEPITPNYNATLRMVEVDITNLERDNVKTQASIHAFVNRLATNRTRVEKLYAVRAAIETLLNKGVQNQDANNLSSGTDGWVLGLSSSQLAESGSSSAEIAVSDSQPYDAGLSRTASAE